KREDITFVGDIYETDVTGAFNAGIKAVWIDREGARDEAHPATYVISETSELTDILGV
ncbi:MAG: HAD family hydrolase, partial [Lachnospiraceae bacterium]|nr:HAD family hydrolase [Lachnospiraceae bacterium]